MPFTLSHPAIVLPFKKISYKYRSMTGLIIGSITPDFEYILRLKIKSIYSHTLPGIFWFDLPLGLLLFLVYIIVVKNKLIDHLPRFLYRKVSVFKNNSNRSYFDISWIVVILSILIGICSHLLWDGFTHPDGYFVKLLPVLSNTISLNGKSFYVYKMIQHSSTILGAVVIAISVYLLPASVVPRKAEKLLKYWTLVLMTTAVLLLLKFYTMGSVVQYGNLIVTAMAGICLGVTIASISSGILAKPVRQ